MSICKKTFALDDETAKMLERLADENGTSQTEIFRRAINMYADHSYMNNQATMINEDVISIVNATVAGMEHRLNNRSNQLLSSLAIEMFIVQRMLEKNLEVRFEDAAAYREEAKLKLNEKNRLFDFTEFL